MLAPPIAWHEYQQRAAARGRRTFDAASFLDLVFTLLLPPRLRAKLYPSSFDPALPYGTQMLGAIWCFCTRTRLRKYTLAPILFSQIIAIAQAVLFPPYAYAFGSPIAGSLGLKDTYGINPGTYTISTDYGTVFDGGTKAMRAFVLNVEANAFITIGTLAIFLVTWVLSFKFLNDLIAPFAELAESTAAGVIAPFAGICAIISALIIALNWMFKREAKAMKYLISGIALGMLAVALFTASPMKWVVSNDGPLVQGRDAGVALAINEAPSGNTTNTRVDQMSAQLITQMIRRPLQVWNFGAVVDATPACAAAWSAGVNSGDPDRVKDGVASCGASNSKAMKASADDPTFGQIIGGGIGFGLFCLSLLAWAAGIASRIIKEVAHVVVDAFKMTFATVASMIPGGPQIFTVHIGAKLLFSYLTMCGIVALSMYSGTVVNKILDVNANNLIYANIVASIAMLVIINIIFKIGPGVDRLAAGTAQAFASTTEQQSSVVNVSSSSSASGSLPGAAVVGATMGYAATAATLPGRRRDREAIREQRRTAIDSNRTAAVANAAQAAYLERITPPAPPEQPATDPKDPKGPGDKPGTPPSNAGTTNTAVALGTPAARGSQQQASSAAAAPAQAPSSTSPRHQQQQSPTRPQPQPQQPAAAPAAQPRQQAPSTSRTTPTPVNPPREANTPAAPTATPPSAAPTQQTTRPPANPQPTRPATPPASSSAPSAPTTPPATSPRQAQPTPPPVPPSTPAPGANRGRPTASPTRDPFGNQPPPVAPPRTRPTDD